VQLGRVVFRGTHWLSTFASPKTIRELQRWDFTYQLDNHEKGGKVFVLLCAYSAEIDMSTLKWVKEKVFLLINV
jgi:hypothetical protein